MQLKESRMNELEFRQWLSNSDVPKKVQSDIVSRLKRLERINGYFDLDEVYDALLFF